MTADATSFEIPKGRKLTITSASRSGQVVVIQDGDAADASATLKIDNGFTEGYAPPGSNFPRGIDRIFFRMVGLESSRTGRTLEFDIVEPSNWNYLGIGPGDRVAFEMDLGSALTVGGVLPDWHSNSLAEDEADVVFYGFVDEVRRSDTGPGEERSFKVLCVDPIQWADKLKLVQDLGREIEIPWLIVNCDDPKDPDRITALKVYDADEDQLSKKYGTGNSLDPTRERLTVGEFLEYLEFAYGAELFDRGIMAEEGGALFDPEEIADLSFIFPKMTFEARGFGSAVREILRANYPDFDLIVDPRTRLWRIRPAAFDLLAGSGTLVVSEVTAKARFEVADASLFAELTGVGSWARFQSSTDRFKSEVRQIVDVDTGTNEIQVSPPLVFDYEAGDSVLPMHDEADRPAILTLDPSEVSAEASIAVDLKGVYSAVEVVSRRRDRERVQVASGEPFSTPLAAGGATPFQAKIVATYDDDIAEDWNYHAHKNRRLDRGADGSGIEIDEIETVGGKTRIYYGEESSAHGNDVSIPGEEGYRSEWAGCTLHLLTLAGDDVETAVVSGIVTAHSRAGWMDSPTNTIRRFRVDLDRDLQETAPGILDQVNDGAPDRFELTSAEAFKPSNPNRRWATGRMLRIESTTEDDDARWADTQGCPAGVEYPDPLDPTSTIQQNAWPIEQASQAPRTFEEIRDFFHLQTEPQGNPNFNPITGGVPRAWILHPKQQPPSASAPSCAVYSQTPEPPKTLDVNKLADTYRYVRVPESGFEGLSWLKYGHSETLVLVTDRWEHASQNPQFAAIALAYHRRVSGVHYSGTIPLVGCTRWARLLDLGLRVQFGAGNTGFVAGVSTEQSAFYGLVQSVRLSFTDNRADIAFESRDVADDLEQELFERLFVSETAELKELRDRLAMVEQQARCLATRPPDPPARKIPACDVAVGGQSVARKTVTIDPKNAFLGGGETSIGVPHVTTGNPADIGGTHNFNPQWVVEREAIHGRTWAIEVPSGAVFGGSETLGGAGFLPDEDAPAEVVSWPFYAGDAAAEALSIGMGIVLPYPPQPFNVVLAEGSTDTVLQLRNALPDDGRFDGGRIDLRFSGDRIARPSYEILSHTDHEITLASPMSEAPPMAGTPATVFGEPVPLVDPSDFPDGGLAVQDSSGAWFVLRDGLLESADLSSGVLVAAGSPVDPELEIGQSNGLYSALGDWDFESAPTAPDPVADSQLATKGYVDDAVAAVGGGGLSFGGAMILGALGL